MALPDIAAFTRLLGVNILRRSPERTEAELPVRAELCNRRGVLHGGAVMALGDMLGGMTVRVSLPDGGRTATIESEGSWIGGQSLDGAISIATAGWAYSLGAAYIDGINVTINSYDRRGQAVSRAGRKLEARPGRVRHGGAAVRDRRRRDRRVGRPPAG